LHAPSRLYAGHAHRPDRPQDETTDILVEVDLDGTGAYDVSTGIGFLDHMVEQFSRHSLIDVTLKVEGDLHIDQHHTTEDSAIALGQAIAEALGDKAGIGRYGQAYSPMDETLARVALDISGRPYLVWKARFTQEKLGEWDTELIEHWFHSVAQAPGSRCTSSCSTARTTTTCAKRSTRASPGRCARRWNSIRARAGRFPPPRASSVAEA
jgi:imidazoleglycerol phosphate dehydratase HisB